MKRLKLITGVLLLFVALGGWAQEIGAGYNPFIPANLDDADKLAVSPVVESSYHRYKIAGDQNYSTGSTFVWYVENGTLGSYDPTVDAWTPLASPQSISNGVYAELPGLGFDGVPNSSEVWVKWNDGSGGGVGYIAVYERSSSSCIVDQKITGFKHNIVAPPEVWFAQSTQSECSEQDYSVELHFNQIFTYSYPYVLTYDYPSIDGVIQTSTLTITDGMLDASLVYMLDLNMVHDIDLTKDENYSLVLTKLRDKYGSLGKIAPLGTAQNQHASLSLTILHLPQTGGMTME